MRKIWIEAALNGAWTRALQPGIPDTIDAIVAEGVACARAGAAIIHTHAYDGGGQQTFDWQVYARIIEGIRAQVDVAVYPSYPPIQTTDINGAVHFAAAAIRLAHIEALAARELLEFAVIDPGSVNFTQVATTSEARPAGTYMNPESHVRHALDFAARHGLHPAFAIYEPGFTRAGAGGRRQDADLPLHVLRNICDRLSAKTLRTGGASGAAARTARPVALDGRRRLRRYPPPDRRGGSARRAYSPRTGGCPAGDGEISSWSRKRCGWCAIAAASLPRPPICDARSPRDTVVQDNKNHGVAYRHASHDASASGRAGSGPTAAVGAATSTAGVGTNMMGNSALPSSQASCSPATMPPFNLVSIHRQRSRISSADLPEGAYSPTARPTPSAS